MFDKFAEFLVFGFVPLIFGALVLPTYSYANDGVLKGEVIYRERIALPPNALLSVELADVSLADAPAAVIGSQTVDPAGQVPIGFEIRFDPSVIRPGMTYALQARITVDDQLLFLNDERHQVDPLADAPQTVLVKRVAQGNGLQSDAIYGMEWIAGFIDGVAKLPEKHVTFRVEQTGRIGGKGPCNSYFASARIDGSKIAIEQAGSTQMACAPAVMQAERALFDAFGKAASYKVENGQLSIADKDGREILRFSAGA